MDEETTPVETVSAESTLRELREQAVGLGFPAEEAEKILAKSAMLAIIDTLKSKEIAEAEVKNVESPKVTTLEPAINSVEEKKITNTWVNKKEFMRNLLMDQVKEGKVGKILIPLNGKEKKGIVRWVTNPKNGKEEQVYVSGAIESIILNGFQYMIPKGIYVEVPERISQEVEQIFQQTAEAGANLLIDRVDPETGQSVRDRL